MTTTTQPLMAHLVLGYPTMDESIRTAQAYVAAGCAILELQIPFSHPTADGPVITHACQEAVEKNHTSVSDCIEAIQLLRNQFPEQEIMVMTYLNRLFTHGVAAFAEAMKELGIQHLIVPDLPVDSPLATKVQATGMKLVPVIAANIQLERLERLLNQSFDFFYLMSDFKITGSAFSLNPRLHQVIANIRATRPEARIGIGFGISTAEQIKLVTSTADIAIIGSSLIKAQQEGRLEAYLEEITGR